MVGVAILMLAVVVTGLVLWRRGSVFQTGWYLRLCTWCIPIGFIAVLAGWTTTEVGRQPWVIYGLMRTAQALTPSLTATDVAISLAVYVVSYIIIFGGGFILLTRLVQAGPSQAAQEEESELVARSARPLSAASEAAASGTEVSGGGHAA
jgi:cytochrome d ubiquinol oxidase subunit I